MLVIRGFSSQRHSFSASGLTLASLAESGSFGWGFSSASRESLNEEVYEIILYPLERMSLGNQRSDFFIFVNILHDLMESRGDDGVMMNPWLSEQQIVGSVGVDT